MKEFLAEIQKEGRYTYLKIPFDPRSEFNIKKGTIYIEGTIDVHAFRSKLLSRGDGLFWLVLTQDMLKSIMKKEGEEVKVRMTTEKRDVDNQERVYSKTDMNVLDAIFNRRSIRRFTEEDISKQDLETILHAGFCAPSAKNKRPWHFVVVKDKEMLEKFSELNPYTKMLANANTAIVVCADENVQSTLDFLYEDSAAAIQNMLLAVHGLGLGAVWCGMNRNSEHYKKITLLCGLPDKIIPVGLLALGYPAEEKTGSNRYEGDCVHYEGWNKSK